MKNSAIVILFSIVLAILLSACGPANSPAATPAPTAEAVPETVSPAVPEVDAKELAVSMIDKEVSELIAVIGEPVSSDYAKSCLGNGDDGELVFDGFTVYTYKEGNSEIIIDVE